MVADVLLHVIDSSSESMDDQVTVTKEVLSSIGAMNKPIIGVYNKSDLCDDTAGLCHYDRNVCISAKHKIGIDELINALADEAPGKKQEYTMLIPYSQGAVLNTVHNSQKVLSETYTEKGTELKVLLDEESRIKLKDYII